MHASLTDGLWDMIKHCWIQEPLERLQVSEVVADLRCALIARQGHSDIPGITMEGDAALSSSVLRHVSRRIGDVSSSTHRRSLPRSSDIRKSVSWPVSRHIIIDGSEASLLDAKFGEFDEAVEITPRGLCGLFRRIHFWKPNRATLSDWNYDDTKVRWMHQEMFLSLITVTPAGLFLKSMEGVFDGYSIVTCSWPSLLSTVTRGIRMRRDVGKGGFYAFKGF